jgi:hypothetical protein
VRTRPRLRRNRRAGLLLDVVLAMALIIIGAFVLYQGGLTFHTILHGAERFFGI